MYVMPEYLKGLPDTTLITSKDIARWLQNETVNAIYCRKLRDAYFPSPVVNGKGINKGAKRRNYMTGALSNNNATTQYWRLGDVKKYVQTLNDNLKLKERNKTNEKTGLYQTN